MDNCPETQHIIFANIFGIFWDQTTNSLLENDTKFKKR